MRGDDDELFADDEERSELRDEDMPRQRNY